MRAAFVTFEGIDGSGKSTVMRHVAERLRARGETVFLTAEPTTNWLGDAIRRAYRDDVGPLAESFLFLADRAAHLEEIREHLGKGEIVLCDRYADSTYAYQGARLDGVVEKPLDFLRKVSEPWLLRPDVILLLRVPAAVGLSRIRDRPDHVRFEDLAFLEKVVANYDRLAKLRHYAVLDADRPVEAVADAALSILVERLRLGRPR